uniref:Putative secreted protein n=1 Tax=Anopheles darlingi TaxID=43151 RepID=A0A2M4DBB4_ANODA
MIARWWPSSVTSAMCWISASGFPRNCSQAVSNISSFWPWILTCAIPVTEIGTPWLVYTVGLSTCSVIVLREILDTEKRKDQTKASPTGKSNSLQNRSLAYLCTC